MPFGCQAPLLRAHGSDALGAGTVATGFRRLQRALQLQREPHMLLIVAQVDEYRGERQTLFRKEDPHTPGIRPSGRVLKL
jgi:hypothetical protein